MELEFDSGFDYQERDDGSISPTESQNSVVEVNLITKILEMSSDSATREMSMNLIDFECDFNSVGYTSEGKLYYRNANKLKY